MRMSYRPRVLRDPAPLSDVKPSDGASSAPSDVTPGATAPAASSPATDVVDPYDKLAEDAINKIEAASSTAEGKETPPKPGEEEPSAEEATPETTTPEGVEATAEATEAEVPFHNHPRWKEVIKQKNEAATELERLRPQAQKAVELEGYLQKNNISDVDLQEALELAALSKADPQAFRKRMGEYLESVDIVLGNKLPSDLQKDVDDGTLSETRAKELATARIALQRGQQGIKSLEQQREEQTHSQINSALTAWEVAQQKADPGYANRLSLLHDRIKSLALANPPKNASEAVLLAEKANKQIIDEVKKFRPKPTERRHLPSNGSSAKPGTAAPVKDMDDFESQLLASATERMRRA